MGVKKAGWGYGFALGRGGLWVKSVLVENMLKGKRTGAGPEEVGNAWEGEEKGARRLGKGA